ncbi:MAG: metallophosphatase family protein [Thiogranum sp.]|nr:metallophosphatase family protein [Thiogranum sp.]
MTKIGVISDTHGLLRDEAVARLGGSGLIIHAGDIGSATVISDLEQIGPVQAIRGNVDRGAWAEAFPDTRVVDVQGQRIYVIHNLGQLDIDPVASGFSVVISGHSHMPKCERRDGVLYLNPGSAGPRRFRLPVAVATLQVSRATVSGEIHRLDV